MMTNTCPRRATGLRLGAAESARGTTYEIGGPENLTFDQPARAVQAADGGTGPPRQVPVPILSLTAATVGRLMPQAGRQARASLVMDSADLTFDGASVRARFPDPPSTPLAQVLSVSV